MKWYKKLYLGDNAKEAKYKIFGKIRQNRFTFNTYLIILSSNAHNLLEIISANELKQSFYKDKTVQNHIYVVGLAVGYDEALEVVERIIKEVYQATGGFDLQSYLEFGKNV